MLNHFRRTYGAAFAALSLLAYGMAFAWAADFALSAWGM